MNRKKHILSALLLSAFALYAAEDVKVMQYKHAGPFPVYQPVLTDSLNVKGQPYEMKNLLKSTVSFDKAFLKATTLNADASGSISFTSPDKGGALHLFSFYLNSDRFVKGSLEITAPGSFEVYVDGKLVSATSELTLEPRRYQVVVKYLATEKDTTAPSLKALFKTKADANIVATIDSEKRYTLKEVMEGPDFNKVSVSPNGKYALVKYVNRFNGGNNDYYAQLIDASTGDLIQQSNGELANAQWMPKTNRLYFSRKGFNGKELVTVDPSTMQQTVIAEDLPDGHFFFTPDEKTLLFMIEEEGPKEDSEIIRVLEPQDRIAGFRSRTFIWRYHLDNGLFEQLTFGHNTTYINDVSADSKYLLFSSSERVYTSLPHSRSSLYRLNLQTMVVDTIWERASYLNHAQFSPDGKQLLVQGSGDSFSGIGLNIKKGQISNSYDGQLFLYDLDSQKARPLTKEFNPSVTNALWNVSDNKIYLVAEDEDYVRLFSCNPSTGEIKKVPVSEDIFQGFSIAKTAPVMLYYGQSVSNANRLYTYNLSESKEQLIRDISAEKLKDVVLGEVHDWNFKSKDGTTIQGRYYLPPHFDPSKKYPLIVNYYGGTSPTERTMEGRYATHMYAAQGYVVYIINPSGTTGYGQEFSARHVNAWGTKTADEIILGTELFCKEHPFVDKSKIGCIGASYGGFMTQYLQTCSNLFAAAISHAGISALSSYWGEGFWGYGYCSVANANTYPWNNPKFFTEHSPLFKADKINTPLLLLHGNADTNVPVGESVQMFAALKILGKTVEFVQVDGQDHHILDYSKRIKWQNTIFAWFAKWLKNEPEWWDTLYPQPTL